jgi:hypothetical protein
MPECKPVPVDLAAITKADVDAARDLWVAARRGAAYEHRALTLLVNARKDAIETYDAVVPIENGPLPQTQGYRTALSQAVARVGAALAHVEKMALHFQTINAQWEENEEKGRSLRIDRRPAVAYAGWASHRSGRDPESA